MFCDCAAGNESGRHRSSALGTTLGFGQKPRVLLHIMNLRLVGLIVLASQGHHEDAIRQCT